MENMGFYQFLEDVGIHIIDYSGKIDLEEVQWPNFRK